MTPQAAIFHIKKHNDAHSRKERFAVHITEALRMAVEALEKQIPKSCCNRFYGDGSVEYVCPTCESAVNDDQKYCDACGQALDWEDVE